MSDIIIGIDPDSKAHGVAVYRDEKLESLHNLTLCKVIEIATGERSKGNHVEFHIENVAKNKGYWHNKGASKPSFGRSSADMGMCRQAQIELERAINYYKFPYYYHGISKCWKTGNGKAEFEKATGWTGRSNEDNRSAAYFGWLGVQYKRQ